MSQLIKFDKEAKEKIVSSCIARDVSLVYCEVHEDIILNLRITYCQLRIKFHSGKDNGAGYYDVTEKKMNDFLESVYDRMNGYKAKDFSDLTVD